jgi:predicted aspartyl protease
MSRTLVLLLAALGITLIVLIWTDGSGQVAGMASEDFARIVMLLTLLASVIAGGMWYRGTLQGALRDAALWLAIFLAFGFLYQISPDIQAMFGG